MKNVINYFFEYTYTDESGFVRVARHYDTDRKVLSRERQWIMRRKVFNRLTNFTPITVVK